MDTQRDVEVRRAAEQAAAEDLEWAVRNEREAREELAEIEKGAFGFLVKCEKRDDVDPIETELALNFWEILSRMEMTEAEQAREKRFIFKVCEALSKHADEDPIKILWDIDDTIGSTDRRKNGFVIRPTFLPFLELITKKYRNAQHGFLTDRGNWEGDGNKEVINAINQRWPLTESLMLSARARISDELREAMGDVRMSVIDIEEALGYLFLEDGDEEAKERTPQVLGGLNDHFLRKAAVLFQTGLLDDEMLIYVDDYDIPLYLDDRGVYLDHEARARVD